MSEKVEGWVAWHPEKGVPKRTYCDDDKSAEWFEFKIYAHSNSSWFENMAEGWIKRPVKLVFLDKEGEE